MRYYQRRMKAILYKMLIETGRNERSTRAYTRHKFCTDERRDSRVHTRMNLAVGQYLLPIWIPGCPPSPLPPPRARLLLAPALSLFPPGGPAGGSGPLEPTRSSEPTKLVSRRVAVVFRCRAENLIDLCLILTAALHLPRHNAEGVVNARARTFTCYHARVSWSPRDTPRTPRAIYVDIYILGLRPSPMITDNGSVC